MAFIHSFDIADPFTSKRAIVFMRGLLLIKIPKIF